MTPKECRWWIKPPDGYVPSPGRHLYDGGLCNNPDINGMDCEPSVPCRYVDQFTKSCYEPEDETPRYHIW